MLNYVTIPKTFQQWCRKSQQIEVPSPRSRKNIFRPYQPQLPVQKVVGLCATGLPESRIRCLSSTVQKSTERSSDRKYRPHSTNFAYHIKHKRDPKSDPDGSFFQRHRKMCDKTPEAHNRIVRGKTPQFGSL